MRECAIKYGVLTVLICVCGYLSVFYMNKAHAAFGNGYKVCFYHEYPYANVALNASCPTPPEKGVPKDHSPGEPSCIREEYFIPDL